MTTTKIIPISVRTGERPDEIEALHERLEQAGYMRMMQIGEPRLSELVARYKSKGYEVEVVPYVDDGADGSAPMGGGCGSGSCGSAANPSSCSSGGCGSLPPLHRTGPRTVLAGVGTIYVRMPIN